MEYAKISQNHKKTQIYSRNKTGLSQQLISPTCACGGLTDGRTQSVLAISGSSDTIKIKERQIIGIIIVSKNFERNERKKIG